MSNLKEEVLYLINEIENMSYDKLKKYVDSLNIDFKDEENIKILTEKLTRDKRKNVSHLGETILKNNEKYKSEIERVKGLYDFDLQYGKLVAGCDEVGRGSFAGPIVSASVILDPNKEYIPYINDSKKLSKAKREMIAKEIRKNALSIKIVELENDIIDEKGISFANKAVLRSSILAHKMDIDFALSDGFKIENIPYKTINVVKGDAKSACIAASSIIAKVYRDGLMEKYSKEFPEYGFESNSGYGSKSHIEAIKKHGITRIHRLSFLSNIL